MKCNKMKKVLSVGTLLFVLMLQPVSAYWSSWESLVVPKWGEKVTGSKSATKETNSMNAGADYKGKGAWMKMTAVLSDKVSNTYYTNPLNLTSSKGTVSSKFYSDSYNGYGFYLTVFTSRLDPNDGNVDIRFNPDY